jgi:hypothetical protein
MNRAILFTISSLILVSCAGPKYLHTSVHDGVEIAYRWAHRNDRPSELLMRMENTTLEDKRVSLVIDLYHQGRTVETLEADTCLRVGQTMTGKLNGIYFVPEQVTTEQIKSGEVQLEMTRTFIEPLPCR